MKRLVALVLALLLNAVSFAADDVYQVLREDGSGFAQVTPNRVFQFPADHAPHPDYRIEWWYLTANLTDAQGQAWGLQWTLFRQSLTPTAKLDGWDSNQMWMAHAALSTPQGYFPEQRFARGGIGQAGVSAQPFAAWLDDWRWQASSENPFPSTLKFKVADWDLSFDLSSDKPWTLQGKQGYSQKSSGNQASYYYSQPHITIRGTAKQNGKTTELTGTAWLDREWSSQPLAPDQQGWDWFSLHFNDGFALMLYQLRNTSGQHWLSGSWVNPEGVSQTLGADDIRMQPLEWKTIEVLQQGKLQQVTLPLSWKLELLRLGKAWTVSTPYPNQWMAAQFPYWEGVIHIDGGQAGMGYMELTGYPLKSR